MLTVFDNLFIRETTLAKSASSLFFYILLTFCYSFLAEGGFFWIPFLITFLAGFSAVFVLGFSLADELMRPRTFLFLLFYLSPIIINGLSLVVKYLGMPNAGNIIYSTRYLVLLAPPIFAILIVCKDWFKTRNH
jgi:hypothetical protein